MYCPTDLSEYSDYTLKEFIMGKYSHDSLKLVVEEDNEITLKNIIHKILNVYTSKIIQQVPNIPVTNSISCPDVVFVTCQNSILAVRDNGEIVGIKYRLCAKCG